MQSNKIENPWIFFADKDIEATEFLFVKPEFVKPTLQ